MNAADYTLWRDQLGSAAGTLPNDVDGGVIGSAQYATWRANYGATPGSGFGSGFGSVVPEPTTLTLLLLAILPSLARKRRDQN